MKTKIPHMLKPIEERFMHISGDYSSFPWDYTHDKLANKVSLKIINHKIAPPKCVDTSIWITCGKHALVNDDIGKLSYDLDLARKIRNKVSANFLQLINHVGCSWVKEKHKQPTIRKITLGNAKEFKYAYAILEKYRN
jgi:hypothetical protein